MEALETLKQNMQSLVARYAQLQQENAALRETNERQREEMMRTHTELVTLQKDYRNLQMAQGLSADPEQREVAKRRLNALIAQVDKAIEVLKQ